MCILVVLAYALLVIYEFIPLYKQKLWHDFWTNAVLGVFSFTVAILLCLDVKIPSPAKPIQELITSIFGK
ncbi:MAG: hypothetical protein ACYDG2_25745 [Ruminiclostridium sp.]